MSDEEFLHWLTNTDPSIIQLYLVPADNPYRDSMLQKASGSGGKIASIWNELVPKINAAIPINAAKRVHADVAAHIEALSAKVKPKIYRCEYCGAKAPDAKQCPHCGAPKPKRVANAVTQSALIDLISDSSIVKLLNTHNLNKLSLDPYDVKECLKTTSSDGEIQPDEFAVEIISELRTDIRISLNFNFESALVRFAEDVKWSLDKRLKRNTINNNTPPPISTATVKSITPASTPTAKPSIPKPTLPKVNLSRSV